MNALIELYDDRPIENVLATEVFHPKYTVFLCPQEVAGNKKLQQKLREYFTHLSVTTELVFLESSLYNSAKLLKQLRSVVQKYGDCVLDITGGTDAALFACGQLCAELDIPAFTYSRKRKCFFSIHNADFAVNLKCEIKHRVEDCFLMAGGAMRKGRVDNSILDKYMNKFDGFFELYLKYRTEWTKIVKYIQLSSQAEKGKKAGLQVETMPVIKNNRGAKTAVPGEFLKDAEKLGFLRDVEIGKDKVSYKFKDQQIRTWLRDIGSVLELYVYKTCIDAGIFNDVRTSALVDWEGDFKRDNVTNEIDVMAMDGILPIFISCKTCNIETEAINELAILRDRFGGYGAKAAIVTTQRCQNITRHRASELGIEVIDLNDIKSGKTAEHLKAMMR